MVRHLELIGTLNDLGDGQFKVSLPLGPGKEWLRMVMKK